MKKIVILGSTGSIGTQTLDIVRGNKDRLRVTAVAAGHNAKMLEAQIREFDPEVAVLYDEKAAETLKARVSDTGCKVLSGMDGLIEAAALPEADIVVGAMVGMIGIRPTIAAIEAGHDIALANKETLVCAGHVIMPLAKKHGVKILPVDSEHSAIFQSLRAGGHDEIEKILLTASGGPFRGKKTEELGSMTAAEALKHPNWDMGPKVTIDSSTLVNKGLEIMEAHWLFDVPVDDIEVYVHPQSIVHSAVQFLDGAVMAQLGVPDMHIPIQYALFYPERVLLGGKRLDLFEASDLTFERPDMDTFKGLSLAIRAAKRGGNMPTVFNAANEAAVRKFLKDEIRFLQIYDIIEEAMEHVPYSEDPSIEEVFVTERETLEFLC
ncbi:MAG: 1-deoxy-D-xylulose-5-phosphate reductoisomerase [Lachnospiraceae bacterium]|nr:1-deoxy-D-xylulose-5-phosphate reductoisomerase [Lachnospiraceae bacterium]MBR1523773.1 1-deoxy-D-xylulose-5-phosphate reductoisomerase [Lachnospiraceae bacterium]